MFLCRSSQEVKSFLYRGSATDEARLVREDDRLDRSRRPSFIKMCPTRPRDCEDDEHLTTLSQQAEDLRLREDLGKALYTVSQLGALAQLGERRLCKPEVTGSIPVRSITIHKEYGLATVAEEAAWSVVWSVKLRDLLTGGAL
jgi:hypothetical protein